MDDVIGESLAYQSRDMRHARVLVEPIPTDLSLAYQSSQVGMPRMDQAIELQEKSLRLLSLHISDLINLGVRPGCVSQYDRPGRPNPGHNWVWWEDGKQKRKYIPLNQVGQFRVECERWSKVQALERLSIVYQETLGTLRKEGGAR